MKIEGDYTEQDWFGAVHVDGMPLDPSPSQKVWNHSPDGFAWGYGGSGPAQLALAILLAAGVSKKDAITMHQRFKAEFLATLDRAPFSIEIDVEDWVERNRPSIVTLSEDTE